MPKKALPLLPRDPAPIRKNWDWEKYPCPPAWYRPPPPPPPPEEFPDPGLDPPPRFMDVTYQNNIIVNKGNIINPTETKLPPTLFWIANEKDWCTLIMVDLDAPDRTNPEDSEFLHWLVVNIPEERITKGEVIAEYFPPNPLPDTGLHRYTFMAYKQLAKIKFKEDYISKDQICGRANFSSAQFEKKYMLDGPVSGNYFQQSFVVPAPPPAPSKKNEEEEE